MHARRQVDTTQCCRDWAAPVKLCICISFSVLSPCCVDCAIHPNVAAPAKQRWGSLSSSFLCRRSVRPEDIPCLHDAPW